MVTAEVQTALKPLDATGELSGTVGSWFQLLSVSESLPFSQCLFSEGTAL